MKLNVGDFVELRGLTPKGKQRVKQHGSRWRVEVVQAGKVLVRSTDAADLRWIDLVPSDQHFTIISVAE